MQFKPPFDATDLRRASVRHRLRRVGRAGPPLLLAALLAGCASVPDVGPRAVLATPADVPSTRTLTPQSPASWPEARWWTRYGDPQLDKLMEEALARSSDVAEVAARLAVAEGRAAQVRAGSGPSLTLNAQAAEARQSRNNGIPPQFVPPGYNDTGRVTLDARYDLDLWGGQRAAVRGAAAEAEAARMDVAQARLVLTTAVASAYADLARLDAERAAATAALRNREASATLVARRVTGGAANQGEADQARAAAARAREDLAALDEQSAVARDQLAALAGNGPDRGLDLVPPRVASSAPLGLPANLAVDLIGRRPDIQAARLRADAAARRIEVARAGFYPNINLVAFLGGQSLGLDQLADAGSRIGQFGAALSLPIFDSGRLRGGYRVARGEYDAAVAAYNRTLVRALRDVADAAAGERAQVVRLAAARDTLAAGEAAYRVAQLRYEAGLTSYLNLLTAEDSVLAQRRALAQLQSRSLALDAALVRALGGGFQAAATKTIEGS